MAEDKSVVVTGAGRGLGRAVAMAFARKGSRVALFSRTARELEEVRDEILSLGGTALACPGDVTRESDLQNLWDLVMERFGTVDLVVNNAAVIGPPRFLEDADPTAWQRTMDVNLNGPYRLIRMFLPRMLDQGSGSVISISSGLARMPYHRFCAYGVSKAGIEQMTRSLSREYGARGVRFFAVDQGVMDTSMQERLRSMPSELMGEEVRERFNELKEQEQLRDPWDVAELIVRLDSADAMRLSGRLLPVADLRRLPA